ncbi:MAG: bifunctional demethylmenaquinone methyltransferase/2-methoxy-6-polyprenyl-1,4-benzoquinol methylase UbiE [Bacteroidales bacterium]|nr:bifunctional demethylmenaquinone methyltransferase/2-methoxy-6-polyprenyl-1,4-benzoquinol methylase UbiE [Bacteroidales bacterium]
MQEEKKNIGNLFDRIAKHYDLLNHLLSFNIDKLWRKKAIKRLTPCDELLDVATGTGDFALEILKQDKAAHITGIDLSKEMLAVGKEKIKKAQEEKRIQLQQEDCASLSLADESFDALTCAFGVRNFAFLDKGLSEMYRVLKPKSKIIILEFSYPKNFLIKAVYNFYFTSVLPLVGKIISKDRQAYSYLPKSVKNFPQREDFLQHLQKAGFRNTGFQSLTFGICTIYYGEKI